MTLDGEVKGIYKDKGLRIPRALTVDKTGSVYVMGEGYYNNNNYIYQISDDIHKLVGHKHGLSRPQSIAYCNKGDKLYVGQNCPNSIKVYQLKKITY